MIVASLALACSAGPPPAPPPAPEAGGPPSLAEHVLRDRVVAVVDEEAILLSDLERAIGLGLVPESVGDGATGAELYSRVLDALIDQRLRFQAAERFGFQRVTVGRIEEEVERIRASFPDAEAFRGRLAALALSEAELRQLLARQLMVLSYVDERLGARVFVSLDDIRTYYEEELVPELERRGAEVPPLDRVREEIRRVLKERRLNEEIVRWTEELRREADVQIFLDEPPEGLPPLVDRLAAPPG